MFEKLLEPSRIGTVKTRNRIYKTAASMMCWNQDELQMNGLTLAFYEAIARGGAGLVAVESPTIDYPLGARWRQRYRLDDDKYIQGISELVDVIHKHDCPAFMQMQHDGPWRNPLFEPALYDGPPVAASPVKLDIATDFHTDLPRELSIAEIQEIVDKFGNAALRARKAGFDGIDINSASSHLLHNFLSPFWNKRQDDYGGTPEKRARFVVEIIKDIKKKTGNDFPIVMCINAIEVGQAIGIDNNECLGLRDSITIAKLFQEAGADAIHVRNHWLGYHVGGFLPDKLFYPEPPIPLNSFPAGYYWKQKGIAANVEFAEAMKKQLSIPVIIVGKIDPQTGEKILEEGKADFIGMHRRLMADPELPNKLIAGVPEEIAPCTACGTCLDATLTNNRHCRINPALGTTNYIIEKADKKKKVVVVGGGPAGMEAARVAAVRGHEVTLYEKSRRLGGLLPAAAVVKSLDFEDLPAIVRYYDAQLKKLGVKVVTGKAVDAATIESIKPDAVIIATGGRDVAPDLNGKTSKRVKTAASLHRTLNFWLNFFSPKTLIWLTKLWIPLGKEVVIIGGDIHGCEIAEFLAKRGRKVTIIEKSDKIGTGIIDFLLLTLIPWFGKKGVTVMTGVKSVEITDKGVEVISGEGEKQIIAADTIIPATHLEPDESLSESLKGKISEVYSIGDCKEPRLIVDAIADGWATGRTV
jgi:2,4-dienoyl-CoA reductase (NADPH2)